MRPILFLVLAPLLLARTGPGPCPPEPRAGQETPSFPAVVLDDAYQLVFFAVLEGLYRDGVSSDVVARLVEPDPVSRYPALFVWTCPLCMPAYNAFLVYGGRPTIAGLKVPQDTFGHGLPAELEARCLAPDRTLRAEALNELVERWIEERLLSMRPSEDERRSWQERFEGMRKQGMERLSGMQPSGAYAGLKRCAVCDGANDGLRRP